MKIKIRQTDFIVLDSFPYLLIAKRKDCMKEFALNCDFAVTP
jgi:hypothetical protein